MNVFGVNFFSLTTVYSMSHNFDFFNSINFFILLEIFYLIFGLFKSILFSFKCLEIFLLYLHYQFLVQLHCSQKYIMYNFNF